MNERTNKAALLRDIRRRWAAIQRKAATRPVQLPQSVSLLGSSLKVAKTDELFPDIRSRILYMSPATEAFKLGANGKKTTCPWATTCAAPCLGHNSGQLAMPASMRARIWKTALYFGDRRAFRDLLALELEAFRRQCDRNLLQGAVRLDGSSDTGEARHWIGSFPELSFYDYTKGYERAAAPRPAGGNWRICYSFDGTDLGRQKARRVLQSGGNVAVVFDALPARDKRPAAPIPREWEGYPVFDGDAHDYLPADPRGAVRGLRFKAARDRAGSLKAAGAFVEPVEVPIYV